MHASSHRQRFRGEKIVLFLLLASLGASLTMASPQEAGENPPDKPAEKLGLMQRCARLEEGLKEAQASLQAKDQEISHLRTQLRQCQSDIADLKQLQERFAVQQALQENEFPGQKFRALVNRSLCFDGAGFGSRLYFCSPDTVTFLRTHVPAWLALESLQGLSAKSKDDVIFSAKIAAIFGYKIFYPVPAKKVNSGKLVFPISDKGGLRNLDTLNVDKPEAPRDNACTYIYPGNKKEPVLNSGDLKFDGIEIAPFALFLAEPDQHGFQYRNTDYKWIGQYLLSHGSELMAIDGKGFDERLETLGSRGQ